jgi:hypothetical protein
VKCICHWHHFETKCHFDVVFFVQCLIVVHRLPPGHFYRFVMQALCRSPEYIGPCFG